ncbi:MAG: hypothetical protein MMC33_002446 [Icmadophila ericetorum]|nr:hypothetical protein [Icmadophila ericetorum]
MPSPSKGSLSRLPVDTSTPFANKQSQYVPAHQSSSLKVDPSKSTPGLPEPRRTKFEEINRRKRRQRPKIVRPRSSVADTLDLTLVFSQYCNQQGSTMELSTSTAPVRGQQTHTHTASRNIHLVFPRSTSRGSSPTSPTTVCLQPVSPETDPPRRGIKPASSRFYEEIAKGGQGMGDDRKDHSLDGEHGFKNEAPENEAPKYEG